MMTALIGVPVVVTRVGGNPELLDDGVTGFLVEPRDREGFASAVARVLKDPELVHGLADRVRAKAASFSIEQMAARYADVYREGAAHPSGGSGSP